MAQQPKKQQPAPTPGSTAQTEAVKSEKLASSSPSNQQNFKKTPQETPNSPSKPIAAKDIPAAIAKETKKTATASNESAAEWKKASTQTVESLNSLTDTVAKNMDTLFSCNNATLQASQNITSQMIGYFNHVFSETVDSAKDFLGCKHFNDVLQCQKKILQAHTAYSMDEAIELSKTVSHYLTEVSDPLAQRSAATFNTVVKSFAAKK